MSSKTDFGPQLCDVRSHLGPEDRWHVVPTDGGEARLKCLSEIKWRDVKGPEDVWAENVVKLQSSVNAALEVSPSSPLRMHPLGNPERRDVSRPDSYSRTERAV